MGVRGDGPAVRLALAIAAAVGLASGAAAQETIESHGFSPFGELKYPPGFPHFDYVDPDAPKGGEISFRGTGASRTFDSLNAFVLAGEPAQGLTRLYDTLLARAYDEPDAAYGLLAERIAYPADRSFVIFHLRPEARFSDGEPVTAEDVAFTLATLAEDGLPAYRLLLDDVSGTEILGEHAIRVDFRDGAMTRDLPGEVGQIPILPAHYYESVDFTRSTMEPPVGSGPFAVADADPGRSITYCLRDDYWGADLPVNVGKDNFQCVVYEYFADNVAAFEALKSGQYLFHEEFTSAQWATGYDFPALDAGWVVQEVIPDNRPSGTQGFWINTRKEKFQDVRVRQALGRMFNFEWSNEQLFYGLYERTDSFFENSDMEARGLPEGAELALLEEFRDQLPEEIFTQPAFVPSVSAPRLGDRNAVREASALLDEAGWSPGDDGMRRNADGEVLSVEFISDSPAFGRIVLPYVENLRRIGVDAEWVQIDSAQMQQRQETFDYDMTVARLVVGNTPSVELRNIYGSASADQPGSFNLSGVSDPVVDALIDRVVGAGSRDEMLAAARALDRVLRSQHIWVSNWSKAAHWLAYWDVFGRPELKPDYIRGEDYWWFEPAKMEALRAEGALR
ncbi:ABC transporter substrate-binding protein [Rhodovulum sp. 12E13]|nr:ABC transporter substrate-binding protein [Rhodovulum sp. 12E13]